MAVWNQNPSWTPVSELNGGLAYAARDGVTFDDMNNIIQNLIYLKKHGGTINVLAIDATVKDNVLILKSEDA